MSLEVRFCVALNGKIIKSNMNGDKLIKENGEQFFEHLSMRSKNDALMFFHELIETGEVLSKYLYLKVNGAYKKYLYKGKFHKNKILLVGQQCIDTSLKQRSEEYHLHKSEIILNALDIIILELNEKDELYYCNKELITQKYYSKKYDKNHPIVETMVHLTKEIRDSHKNLQRFHVYNDVLYHIHGIYLEDNDHIIFIIDNKNNMDEFNSLIKDKHQMESVSHLAAGFAHELRNPLSVIRGFIQLSGLTNNIEKYYRTILSEIDRMNEIIEDFLSLSRNNSRKLVQEPNELFQSLIPLIRSECILRNITFDYHFEKTNRKIFLDKSMIKQIILNLLRNAVEAFPEDQHDKRFKIETKALKHVYQVKVSDNGPGMKKSVLEQLGKPFFTTKENGTGIGLPLCKKIIGDHKGEFFIESKLGEGTVITFTLPFIEE
ncbi:nitrogen regulation protein NR(II) [Scopulibacillus cellulosilyticus]|uniref:histidine kinase n=1 Tax=Scopulibacillus cellulosilyticus TaxID=2665665 RepID=A0ABW2PVC3_9BACL